MADENRRDQEQDPLPEQDQEMEAQSEVQFGEVDALQVKVANLEALAAQLKDQLLRKAAEFENYKKRTEVESAALVKYSNEQLILRLLPVLDDFGRFMKSSGSQRGGAVEGEKPNDAYEQFFKGAGLIHEKFRKILEAIGVKEFETVGKPFDPYYHDALMQLSKEGIPVNTVIEEVEKGYLLHDKVIRHARVIVAGEPPGEYAGDGVDLTNGSDEE